MPLITRISRLFTADFHAVLDRIEEPDVLLKQAIRDMEEEIARAEQQVKWLAHEHGQHEARKQETEGTLRQLDEELDVCFEAGEEDLARSSMRRRLEAERRVKELARRIAAAEKALGEQRAALDENRRYLTGMRQKAEILVEEEAGRASGPDQRFGTGGTVSDDEVEVAFLRERQRRAGK
ncbi:MAG: PspA/IM30 family protein [Gammaproteobacteria bacterium]